MTDWSACDDPESTTYSECVPPVEPIEAGDIHLTKVVIGKIEAGQNQDGIKIFNVENYVGIVGKGTLVDNALIGSVACVAVDAEEDYAWRGRANESQDLTGFDISDEDNPVKLWGIDLASDVGVTIGGAGIHEVFWMFFDRYNDRLFVSTFQNTQSGSVKSPYLVVYDVSNRTVRPVLLDFIPIATFNRPTDVAVLRNGTEGWLSHELDAKVRHFTVASDGTLAFSGNEIAYTQLRNSYMKPLILPWGPVQNTLFHISSVTAAVSNQQSLVHIFDITNPASGSLLSTITMHANTVQSLSLEVNQALTRLYVKTSRGWDDPSSTVRIQIFDITDLENPVRIGEFNPQTIASESSSFPQKGSLFLTPNEQYLVCHTNNQFSLFDPSDEVTLTPVYTQAFSFGQGGYVMGAAYDTQTHRNVEDVDTTEWSTESVPSASWSDTC